MTIVLPLDTDFCLATTHDVRSWSYGAVTSPRRPFATSSDNVQGTLHDQRIFGPIHDFQCACGKYVGERYEKMICDQCGVKIAPNSIRGSRFGHIEFPAPIAHPFSTSSTLQCFPVLPIRLMETPAGSPLPALYDRLVEAAVVSQSNDAIYELITAITAQLVDVTITMHHWRLPSATTLAQGMVLKRKENTLDGHLFCDQCGYLLSGLSISVCPGCRAPRQ